MGNGVLDSSKLGSPAALSLLPGGDAIAQLLIGGAILAVAGAVFTYKEYKAYEEKKHKKKIEEINKIYIDKLKKIAVPFFGVIEGFPPIFQPTKDGKYESLHYTMAEIKDIASILPTSGDVALVSYRESIRAALRKLKEYYYLRAKGNDGETDDITLSVLCYLMHMIDTKCFNFLGYEYDIAYLGALAEFINVYASHGNTEHSQHFSRLEKVYTNLLDAKQKLIKHKEYLSMEETVSALQSHCQQHSDLLIRTLVKMVADKNDTDLAETVNHDALMGGILREKYIRWAVWGVDIRYDPQIDIPDSIFRDWIKNLSLYYLKSLNIDDGNKHEPIPSYNNFFDAITNINLYIKSKKKKPKNDQEKAFNEKMEKQLQLIASVLKNSDNFIGREYRESDDNFHVVKDDQSLVERAEVIANFAKLIDDVISLQYLCIHLTKSIKQLGEIYVKDPHHFKKIFGSLDKLCILVQTDLKTCLEDFTNLQIKNKNQMQEAKKELFPNEVKKLLDALSVGVERYGAEVKNCRAKAKKAVNKDTIQSASYEMLVVAKSLLGRYFKPDDVNDVPEKTECESASNKSQESTPSNPVDTPASTPSQINKTSKASVESIAQLQDRMQQIHKKITTIPENESEPKGARGYINVYNSLQVMQKKSVAMIMEQDKSKERSEKAEKILELTLSLANKTSDYINQTSQERKQGGASFAREIHKILNNGDNSEIIDAHYSYFSRFIYTHLCDFGLFRTDTRKKFNDFDIACSKLRIG